MQLFFSLAITIAFVMILGTVRRGCSFMKNDRCVKSLFGRYDFPKTIFSNTWNYASPARSGEVCSSSSTSNAASSSSSQGSDDLSLMSSTLFPRSSDLIHEMFRDIEQTLDVPKTFFQPMALDIKETKEKYEVTADLPGIQKDNINIELFDNVLFISSERKKVQKSEDANFRREERYSGISSRSVLLPENVDPNNVSASLSNGVLHITLTKKEKEMKKLPKKIQIH